MCFQPFDDLAGLSPGAPENENTDQNENAGDAFCQPGRFRRPKDRVKAKPEPGRRQPGAHPARISAFIRQYCPVFGPVRTILGKIGALFSQLIRRLIDPGSPQEACNDVSLIPITKPGSCLQITHRSGPSVIATHYDEKHFTCLPWQYLPIPRRRGRLARQSERTRP